MNSSVNTPSSHHISARKEAILLVSFGTSIPTAKISLNNMQRAVEKAFPNTEIRWAYTSGFIRKKINKQGIIIDSPLVALSKMIDDGYTHIAVQSMHTIPGSEYEYLQKTVKSLQYIPKGAQKIVLGKPLLYYHKNIDLAVKAMLTSYETPKENEAIVFMGHGSPHQANVYYPALNYYFNQQSQNIFMATVDGYPGIMDIIKQLKTESIKKVRLIPFMSVAGDHAKKDMCGPQKESWQNLLLKEGYEVEPILKGTGEIDEIINLWLSHLRDAYNQLKS